MRWMFRSALAAVAAIAIVAVAAPVWLIQPFAPQTLRGLAWSHTLKQIAPAVTASALAISIALVAALWRFPAGADRERRTRRHLVRRSGLAFLVVLVAATAWFSRQNHFEWMFRPNADPAFVATNVAADVDPAEPVIGVALAADAVAFPITRLGYHHLINTTIGRQPIVATY